MKFVRKDLDQTKAVITVSVTKDDYNENVEKYIRNYRKKANVPGFRPGNVPVGLIKKLYGKAIVAEEVNKLVSDGLFGYVKENNIKFLGEPLPVENHHDVDFENSEDFDFDFEIGLAPQFDVDLSKSDKITYYNIKVSDQMIDNQVKSYTSRFGKYTQVDVVEENDMVKGELLEMANGKVNEDGLKVKDAVLTPAYMKNEDQKALFVGKNIGDKVVFNPQVAYENEVEISSMLKISKDEAKRITSDFMMQIEGIARYEEGEINQELFDKVFGEGAVTSENEFRQKIAESIKENLTADSDYKFGIDAQATLSAKYNDLKFPDQFLKRWLLYSNENMTSESLEEDYPRMIKDLTWHLIKDKIADANGIKVETADVQEYAKKVAKSQFAQYGMVGLEDAIIENYAKDLMKKEETVKNFVDRAMEEKVLDYIKGTVKLNEKEISVEDFNKMFQETGEN
ncbi:MAG: trigger factor [Bacteroidetes bacterium]|nr:trigger factor [Bacteroidota bacterium]